MSRPKISLTTRACEVDSGGQAAGCGEIPVFDKTDAALDRDIRIRHGQVGVGTVVCRGGSPRQPNRCWQAGKHRCTLTSSRSVCRVA